MSIKFQLMRFFTFRPKRLKEILLAHNAVASRHVLVYCSALDCSGQLNIRVNLALGNDLSSLEIAHLLCEILHCINIHAGGPSHTGAQ